MTIKKSIVVLMAACFFTLSAGNVIAIGWTLVDEDKEYKLKKKCKLKDFGECTYGLKELQNGKWVWMDKDVELIEGCVRKFGEKIKCVK